MIIYIPILKIYHETLSIFLMDVQNVLAFSMVNIILTNFKCTQCNVIKTIKQQQQQNNFTNVRLVVVVS